MVHRAMEENKIEKRITVKLTPGEHRRVEAAAREMNTTKQAFLATAANLLAGFDVHVWHRLNSWADRLQLPPAVVIAAMTVYRLATIEAEGELLGDYGRVELPEFRMTADGLLETSHLMAVLKADHIEELRAAMGGL